MVFRKARLTREDFAEQLGLAIADVVRDYYITRDAYEKDDNTDSAVMRTNTMWRDNIFAMFAKYQYLLSKGVKESVQVSVVEAHLTPLIDSLQTKYSNQTLINISDFEKIQLTSVDMIALQPDQTFPVVVPSFSLVTIDNRLDYGEDWKLPASFKF